MTRSETWHGKGYYFIHVGQDGVLYPTCSVASAVSRISAFYCQVRSIVHRLEALKLNRIIHSPGCWNTKIYYSASTVIPVVFLVAEDGCMSMKILVFCGLVLAVVSNCQLPKMKL